MRDIKTETTDTESLKQKIDAILAHYKKVHPLASRKSIVYTLFSSINRNPISTLQLGIATIFDSAFKERIKKLIDKDEIDDKAFKKIHTISAQSQLIQALLGENVNTPDTIIHLSILYWYTDEILDNTQYSLETRKKFTEAISKFISEGGDIDHPLDESPPDDITALNRQLVKIQYHVKAFFAALAADPLMRNRIDLVKNHVSALHTSQTEGFLKQYLGFYTLSDAVLPDEDALLENEKRKGALSFKLYGLLLAPKISQNQLEMLEKLGELYQLADDIDDFLEDLESFTVTPAIISLMAVKPLVKETFLENFNLLINYSGLFNEMTLEEAENLINMNTFYQHCYDVLMQIQQTFSMLKQDKFGIKIAILDIIEQKMVSDIREGIEDVLNAYPLPQKKILPRP